MPLSYRHNIPPIGMKPPRVRFYKKEQEHVADHFKQIVIGVCVICEKKARMGLNNIPSLTCGSEFCDEALRKAPRR